MLVAGGAAQQTLPPAATGTGDEFQQLVAPVLAKNCAGCHNDRVRTGRLSLDGLSGAALLALGARLAFTR